MICALGLVLGLTACKHETKMAEAPAPKVEGQKITMPENAPQVSAVSVESVQSMKQLSMAFAGRLVWNDDSTVRVFSPVQGRVNKILINLGQQVTAGEALAKIASPDFDQAQADARKAQVDLQLSERTLARVKELYEHGASAQKDMEAAEADHTRAVSEKNRTATRLAFLGTSAAASETLFTLKAPIAGTVVDKNINPGLEVRPDAMMANVPQYAQPLFVISDPTSLWLQLDVAESEIPLLKVGQKLSVHPRAYPDKTVDGRIDVIGDALDPNTRTIKVRASVDNIDRLLKAEMYVTAQVAFAADQTEKSVVDVSSKAVFLKDNQYFVFVQNAPGQFERRAVKVAGDGQNGKIPVREGLSAGEKVVTDGSLLLQALLDGQDS
jgi:membrane fusion protein, heavy metal efflux system